MASSSRSLSLLRSLRLRGSVACRAARVPRAGGALLGALRVVVDVALRVAVVFIS